VLFITSGTGKATEIKFGQYILRVHLNKPPLKTLEKRDCGPETDQFLKYPLLSQEWVKLRISNFVCTFIGSIGTKAGKAD